MFNKILFDRNAFDRSVSSNNLLVAFNATGSLNSRIVIQTPLNFKPMLGGSSLSTNIRMQQNVGLNLSGEGQVKDLSLVLRLRLTTQLKGSGTVAPNFSIQTPFRGALGGSGGIGVSDKMYIIQHMFGIFNGNALLSNDILFKTSIEPVQLNGGSVLNNLIALQLPITTTLSGSSKLELRRLGALNENMFELVDIDLMPGESVIIDTDLLQVLFGPIEDVSSVTTNSVFFELNPGENEILISTDVGEKIDVDIIWQNRWL